jgi:hypothetical protein
MHPLLWILLVPAALLLLLIVALYVIPARITGFFRAAGGEILISAALSWCGISLVFSLEHREPVLTVRWLRWEVVRKPLRREEPRPESAGEEKPSRGWRPSLPEVLRLIGMVAGSLSFSRFRGQLLLGLASPAATGRLYGYWTAFRYAVPADDRISFDLTPVFDRQVLEGEGELVILLHRPLTLILQAFAILVRARRREGRSRLQAAGSPV